MTKTKKFVLLDVDDTLIYDSNTLNLALIQSLCANGVREVYLFSNMSIRDITHSLESASPNAQGIDSDRILSRAELINELQKKGITVVDVITPADPSLDHGLGAPFRELYMPIAKRAFPAIYTGREGNPLVKGSCQKDTEYEANLTKFEELNRLTAEANVAAGYLRSSKQLMFNYFLKEIKASGLHEEMDQIEIVFADDRLELIDELEAAVAEIRRTNFNINFHPIHVTRGLSQFEISRHLERVRKSIAENCILLIKEALASMYVSYPSFNLVFQDSELRTFDKLDAIISLAQGKVQQKSRMLGLLGTTQQLSPNELQLYSLIASVNTDLLFSLEELQNTLCVFNTGQLFLAGVHSNNELPQRLIQTLKVISVSKFLSGSFADKLKESFNVGYSPIEHLKQLQAVAGEYLCDTGVRYMFRHVRFNSVIKVLQELTINNPQSLESAITALEQATNTTKPAAGAEVTTAIDSP